MDSLEGADMVGSGRSVSVLIETFSTLPVVSVLPNPSSNRPVPDTAAFDPLPFSAPYPGISSETDIISACDAPRRFVSNGSGCSSRIRTGFKDGRLPWLLSIFLVGSQENDEIREFYEDVLDRNEIICLSGKWDDKLMWAHYAESHAGMCVEYTLQGNRKEQVIPVAYVANRQSYDDEIKTWLENKGQALEQMVEQKGMNGIQRRQMHSCGKIMYTKDSVWKYEKEYRIVTRNHKDIENDMLDSYKNQKGSLHKTKEFGLSLSGNELHRRKQK